MKITISTMLLISLLQLLPTSHVQADLFDNLTKGIGNASSAPASGIDDTTIAKGLKEALTTGSNKAVNLVSQQNGYFNNEMIKILVPEKIRPAVDLLGKFGFQKDVDAFVLSMNRAAEKAAPKAKEHLTSALKEMTFEDARKILNGDKTAATEYFKQKSGKKIYDSFKPVVSDNMKNAGVAQNYNRMTDSLKSIPFADQVGNVDLDHHVTNKAVDGLFYMLGEEEKKIRTNPAARGTELLKKVFGK